MIEEEGRIIEVKGETAFIKAERTTSCDKCMAKEVCTGLTETSMLIEALNPVNAKAGDHVIFNVGAATVVKAGVLLYLFPLIGFISGIVAGQLTADRVFPGRNPDIVSAIFGFIFLALTAAGVHLYGRRAQKSRTYMPTVVRIV